MSGVRQGLRPLLTASAVGARASSLSPLRVTAAGPGEAAWRWASASLARSRPLASVPAPQPRAEGSR